MPLRSHNDPKSNASRATGWIPPFPPQQRKIFTVRWRLVTMLALLLAAGPIALLLSHVWPYLAGGWLLMIVATRASIASVAILIATLGRLQPEVVMVLTFVPFLIAIPDVAWLVKQMIREQAMGQYKTVSSAPGFYLRLFAAFEKLAISTGLVLAFAVSFRRKYEE